MRYLKDYKLFESSKFPTDKKEIKKLCKKYKIKNYTINKNGTVDVDGDVVMVERKLTRLPLKFGKVSGHFDCYGNKLKSLEGAPKEVGGDFDCTWNKLTSLEGAPIEVGGDFDCENNKLTTLIGAPKKVDGDFECSDNKLKSLSGAPEEVGGDFWCHSFSGGKLLSLEGAPKEIGKNLYIEGNPVFIFVEIFEDTENLMKSLKYNYFAGGNKIHESRFVRACDDLGIQAPDEIEGYVWV